MTEPKNPYDGRLRWLQHNAWNEGSKAMRKRCEARIQELEAAIDNAFEHSNGRVSEWGERAEECFRILEVARRKEHGYE